MSALSLGGGREPGDVPRWVAAGLVIAALHAGAGWWLATHAFAPPPEPDGAPGVTVELEPVAAPVPPTAEPKPMENSGPSPDKQVAEAPDTPPEAPPPLPPETSPAEPPRPAQPPPSAEAAVAPPPEPARPIPQAQPDPAPPPPVPTPVPDVVPPAAAPSEAVLAPPPPPPKPVKKVAAAKPPKPEPPKPDPREVAREKAREAQAEARKEAREEARREAQAEARAERQSARQQARAARAAAAREGGGPDSETAAPRASGAAISAWKGEVQAHMNAYTPASPNGNNGSVKVTFSVDRTGRITGVGVSSSSGDPQLDRAALSAVRRASPVPAPPPEMGGHATLGLPVHFN